MQELNVEKRKGDKSKMVMTARQHGDTHRKERLVVVTNKLNTFAPNKHYYCSMGPYWWPDPIVPGRYISRDGFVNPESKSYDRVKLLRLREKCYDLSQAFYLTEDTAYYELFVRQLKAWFVDEETYMYPNLEFSQVIPGQNDNQGRSIGMIDAYEFNTVIESIRLVNSVKMIDKDIMSFIKKWFLAFAEWADQGIFGTELRNTNNNIVLAFDVTLVNMFLFGGNEKRAKEIADEFAEKRINGQIMEDGSQPAELKRTKAYFYSLYNLAHIVDFCCLAKYWYPNYYQEHRERIDAAFAFLEKYANSPESFPYQQITSWKDCKEGFEDLRERKNHCLK